MAGEKFYPNDKVLVNGQVGVHVVKEELRGADAGSYLIVAPDGTPEKRLSLALRKAPPDGPIPHH